MDVSTLQQRLSQTREKTLVAIADLPDEALQEPGAVGDWSIATTLAVLSTWEAELVTGLAEVQRGKRPARLLDALSDVEATEQRRAIENSDRDLDDVFKDLQGARIHLEIRLEDLTKRDLNDVRRQRWSKRRPLWEYIADASYRREKEFLPAVEAYARRWLENNPPERNEAVIDLIDVGVLDELDNNA